MFLEVCRNISQLYEVFIEVCLDKLRLYDVFIEVCPDKSTLYEVLMDMCQNKSTLYEVLLNSRPLEGRICNSQFLKLHDVSNGTPGRFLGTAEQGRAATRLD